MKKIKDFGSKIGGAKKDIWELINSISDEKCGEFANKSKLWPRPNYESLEKKGISKEVLFWRNEIRKSVKSRPKSNAKKFIEFVSVLRNDIERCKTLSDINNFYKGNPDIEDSNGVFSCLEKADPTKNDNRWKYVDHDTKEFFSGKIMLKYLVRTEEKIKTDLLNSNFMCDKEAKEAAKYKTREFGRENITVYKTCDGLYNNKINFKDLSIMYNHEKDFSQIIDEIDSSLYIVFYDDSILGIAKDLNEASSIVDTHKANMKKLYSPKKTFLPPHLSKIERTGSSYDYFRLSDGNVLLARYGLKGGEFGNYTTSKDRLGSINMAYDAFEDLSKVLNITPESISLEKTLSIAFGARGRGNAMAHYEPEKNVINITKIRGAGSLAHEWAHAMDKYLGSKLNVHGFLSDNISFNENLPESMKNLVSSFKEQNNTETDFYKNSKEFDNDYKKSGNGYWSSSHEMFARAFACYVLDKLKEENKKSDYLVGHAECAYNGILKAFPVGKEREIINKNFDIFIDDMIKRGYLKEEADNVVEINSHEDASSNSNTIDIIFYEGESGQLKFC